MGRQNETYRTCGGRSDDRGLGGTFPIAPPDYEGPLPEDGYVILYPPSYTNRFLLRAFYGEDGVAAAVDRVKQDSRAYPWEVRDAPPETEFVHLTDAPFNTIQTNDLGFRRDEGGPEPGGGGGLHAIGIRKGEPFEPVAELREMLFHYAAAGITPAMVAKRVGVGPQYALAKGAIRTGA